MHQEFKNKLKQQRALISYSIDKEMKRRLPKWYVYFMGICTISYDIYGNEVVTGEPDFESDNPWVRKSSLRLCIK